MKIFDFLLSLFESVSRIFTREKYRDKHNQGKSDLDHGVQENNRINLEREDSLTVDEFPAAEFETVVEQSIQNSYESYKLFEEPDSNSIVETEDNNLTVKYPNVFIENDLSSDNTKMDFEAINNFRTRSPFSHPGLIDSTSIEELDVDNFLKNLASDELDEIISNKISLLERYFFEALKRFEYIGELPLSEKAYHSIRSYIRINAYTNGKINPRYTLPTLFSISMVFCARYSDNEARDFWKPYARQVWGLEPTQYFQKVCRELFTFSRQYLQKHINYSFSIQNQGDVVRPVYQHAIIPHYLQIYFAEWLVANLKTLLNHSSENLLFILQDDELLEYVPGRLKNFIRDEETKETAARLIARMTDAIRLFQELDNPEAVESMISSNIEKSIWDVIYKKLMEDPTHWKKLKRFTPQLAWLWDLEVDDIFLTLSKFRSNHSVKPDSITWAEKDAEDLKGNEVLKKIYPWRVESGEWEVDPERIPAKGPLDGIILILSENFDLDEVKQIQPDQIYFERSVPILEKPLLYFRVDPQRNGAVKKEEINSDGKWIIVSNEDFYITDNKGNKIQTSSRNLPYYLREAGFNRAIDCDVQLPITVNLGEKPIVFSKTQEHHEFNPSLRGIEKVPGLSKDIPQIFASKNIDFAFSIYPDSSIFQRTYLEIKPNGKPSQLFLLADLVIQSKIKMDGNLWTINFSTFIEHPGGYSTNLRRNTKPLLNEPLQFSWLPESVEIIGPAMDVCYSPLTPLRVIIRGVSKEDVIPIQDEKSKILPIDNSVTLEWKVLNNPNCRFDLSWQGSMIHFKWDIDRVSAWVQGGVDKNLLFENQAKLAVLQVRGRPKENFSWLIGDAGKERTEQLNTRGEYQANLLETAVRDMLSEEKQALTSVSISIRNKTWKLFDYFNKPKIEINKVHYKKPELEISLIQFHRYSGFYTLQVRDVTNQSNPEILSTMELLKEKFTLQKDFHPGNYQIEILLHDVLICTSPIFQVDEELEQIDPENKKVHKSENWGTSGHYFQVLTSTRKDFFECSVEGLPIEPVVEQLKKIHTLEEWIIDAPREEAFKRLLPAWAVLKHPLRFTTNKHARILHVYPEKVAYGGRAGSGYVDLKIAGEIIRMAANWKPGKNSEYSELLMRIPHEQNVTIFSELDPDDLWPAYQCVDCGTIVASREGTCFKLPPSIVQLHLHEKNRKLTDQFDDTVYKKHIEVDIRQVKDKDLHYVYDAKDVINNLTFKLLSKGYLKINLRNLECPINLYSDTDYKLAIYDLFDHVKTSTIEIQNLRKAKELVRIFQYFGDDNLNIPAISAMGRLVANMKPVNDYSIIPINILTLAMILRMKANRRQDYKELLTNLDVSEERLVEFVKWAVVGCPKLLEWSVAWTELFYLHSVS